MPTLRKPTGSFREAFESATGESSRGLHKKRVGTRIIRVSPPRQKSEDIDNRLWYRRATNVAREVDFHIRLSPQQRFQMALEREGSSVDDLGEVVGACLSRAKALLKGDIEITKDDTAYIIKSGELAMKALAFVEKMKEEQAPAPAKSHTPEERMKMLSEDMESYAESA